MGFSSSPRRAFSRPWHACAVLTVLGIFFLPGSSALAKKSLGRTCNNNNECTSGACDAGMGTSKTATCVPINGTGKSGDHCSNDSHCRSRKCVGLKSRGGRWIPGKCKLQKIAGLGQSCKVNEECSSRRCDMARGNARKCIPNDNTGKLGDYCSHDNHCRAGKYHCIGHHCSTPLANGKSCGGHSDCASGCCNQRKCSTRSSCYKAEDALCDFFTAGGCSLVVKSSAEIEQLAKTTKVLRTKVKAVAAKIKKLEKTVRSSLERFTKDVTKEALLGARAALNEGQKLHKSTVSSITKDLAAATRLVAEFAKKGPGRCGPAGTLKPQDAVVALRVAKDRLAGLKKAVENLAKQPLKTAGALIKGKLERTIKQQEKLARSTIEATIRQQKDFGMRSLELALAPVEAFIKDPMGTLTNPLGTARKQIEKVIDAVGKHIAAIDRSFNASIEALRKAALAEVQGNTKDIVQLLADLQQHRVLADEVTKKATALAKTCAQTDSRSLGSSVKRRPKMARGKIAVPAGLRFGASAARLKPYRRGGPGELGDLVQDARSLGTRLAAVHERRQTGAAAAKKMRLSTELDKLFKGKSKAQIAQARQAYLAAARRTYGKYPRAMKAIEKQLDKELHKRGY